MKKLALLLTALGLVSAAAYAAPELTVTHVGQEIEIENVDHNGTDLDDVWLWNNVGLAYGDWTFGLTAGKEWDVNFEDHDKTDKGVKSGASRLQIDVWNKVTDDLKLGFRYRGQNNYDRFYARWDYNHGMFWSSGDVWYESKNGAYGTDWVKSEFFPLGLKYGAFKVGYFVNYEKMMGGADVVNGKGDKTEYFEHQIRAYATLYKGEKLTLTTEGRFTISAENDYEGSGKETDYGRHYDDFGRIRLYLGADYKVTENLNVYGKYGYEFREWELEDNNTSKDDYTENAYQNFVVGWKYTF